MPSVVLADDQVDSLMALLVESSKITLLCGCGCQSAHEEIVALATHLKAPIVHALGRKEHVEWDNPHDVALTGLIGFPSRYKAMLECDTFIMQTLLDSAIFGDIKSTLRTILFRLVEQADTSHLERYLEHFTF